MRSRRSPDGGRRSVWRGAGVRPPPRPRTPSQRECVFMIAHGRRNTGPRAPEGSYLKSQYLSTIRKITPPPHSSRSLARQPHESAASHASACLSHARSARAHTHSPRARARAPSARTPLSPAPPALHPPGPTLDPSHPRAGFHASSDALLSAWRSRHSIMCIRRLAPPPPAQAFFCPPPPQALGASCALPAFDHAALEPRPADAS